jgi:hypothetical protein
MTMLNGGRADPVMTLANEFAAVRVSVDRLGHSPRLLVEDITTGNTVLLDPLELASFCEANDQDRDRWLLVGDYRGTPSEWGDPESVEVP